MKDSFQKLASLMVMFVLFPIGFGTLAGVMIQCVIRLLAALAHNTPDKDAVTWLPFVVVCVGVVAGEVMMAAAAEKAPEWPPNIFNGSAGWKKVIK